MIKGPNRVSWDFRLTKFLTVLSHVLTTGDRVAALAVVVALVVVVVLVVADCDKGRNPSSTKIGLFDNAMAHSGSGFEHIPVRQEIGGTQWVTGYVFALT